MYQRIVAKCFDTDHFARRFENACKLCERGFQLDVVQRFAHWLPMTPVIDLINLAHLGTGTSGEALAGGALVGATTGMILPMLLWTALALYAGLRGFRWDPRG